MAERLSVDHVSSGLADFFDLPPLHADRYCNLAIRLDDLSHLPDLTLRERFSSWWRYQSWRLTLWMYTFGAESKTVLDRWKGVRRKELVLEL